MNSLTLGGNMEIELASSEETPLIVNLLNDTTQYLLSKKIMQWEYPWDSTLISQDIFGGYQYVVKEDDRIAAVFSLKEMPVNFWTKECTKYQMYLYRIAVAPTNQRKNTGKLICSWVQDYSKRYETKIYLDCWAGSDKLKNFYQSAGFLYLGDFPEKDYQVSVFLFDTKQKLE
jgi:hypothetical protein